MCFIQQYDEERRNQSTRGRMRGTMKNKWTYDRNIVGERLRNRRTQLGWSRGEVAEKIGIVEKYYADIERGACGMSVETLMKVTQLYGISIDHLLYGGQNGDKTEQAEVIATRMQDMPEKIQNRCVQIVELFLESVNEGRTED